jgi:L-lactate dehydrogenase complex protein LldE
MTPTKPSVGLFITCISDLMRPSIGFATAKLLSDVGCRVVVPEDQTCCGQPAHNEGDKDGACDLARHTIDVFGSVDYVVAPSASCVAMVCRHYAALFERDPSMAKEAKALADKTFELTHFLKNVLESVEIDSEYSGVAAYHDGCSGLRELDIKEQPRDLLAKVRGLELRDPWMTTEPMNERTETCCGFGGLFSMNHPEISVHIADAKLDALEASGVDTLVSGEPGCLLHLQGRLKRRGSDIKVYHVAEILAGVGETPAIGEPQVAKTS